MAWGIVSIKISAPPRPSPRSEPLPYQVVIFNHQLLIFLENCWLGLLEVTNILNSFFIVSVNLIKVYRYYNIQGLSVNTITQKNVKTKNFLDLDIELSSNYTCDGSKLGEQLQDLKPIKIPGWSSVKSLHLIFEATGVDDAFVFKINDEKVYESLSCGDEGANCSSFKVNIDKKIPFVLKQEYLEISFGARNDYPNLCFVKQGKGKITLSY